MLASIESMGSRLLGLFVPKVDAAAAADGMQACWGACWQCNKLYGHPDGRCSCNAPCCAAGGNRYRCSCDQCP
ncbi:hypothetical protein [Streptomyces chrestomyceticus]|uniref:Uncharacterized protein n=1 Tax=Streptomyces chrestomyceticus TaxID=68185 RepID=A0ABU7WRL0_9ACTN|nr:hypothetical protein [Streptomyces chrestomyceticus]